MLLIIAGLSPLSANATPSFSENGLYYEIYNWGEGDFAALVESQAAPYSGSVVIPDSVSYNGSKYPVTFIHNRAFRYCTELIDVSIPATVSHVDTWFEDSPNLEDIFVDPDNPWYSSYDGILLSNYSESDETALIRYPAARQGELTIPTSVVEIGMHAFSNMEQLESVSLPDNITIIGDSAFAGCINLKDITLPPRLWLLGNYVFEQTAITELNLPFSLEVMGCAFFDTKVKRAFLPASLVRNDMEGNSQFFYGANSLEYIEVDQNNPVYCAVDGVLFSKDMKSLLGYPVAKQDNKYSIPESVTQIGPDAFAYCKTLTNIHIPEGVTTLGSYCFCGCENLEEIIIPNSVTTLNGLCQFAGCYAAKKLSLSENITEITYSMFNWCENLTEVTIPDGVVKIADSAFADCHALEYVTLPKSLKSLGAFALAYCHVLQEINIPEGIETIFDHTFYWSPELKLISIPASVKHIDGYAFGPIDGTWSSLQSLYSYSDIPPVCDTDAFYYVNPSECTLFIPQGSADAYRSAYGWAEFTKIDDSLADVDSVYVSEPTVKSSKGMIYVSCRQSRVTVYSVAGTKIFESKSADGDIRIPVPSGGMYVVAVNGRTFRVIA